MTEVTQSDVENGTIVPLVTAEHVDVLIVGAGLSGIGAGYHLQRDLPGQKTYAILEARESDRRHLGPVPLSRRSARTRTCSRSATRSGPWTRRRRRSPTARRSSSYVRETARDVRRRPQDPLRPPRRRRRVVERGCALDGRGRAHRHAARPCSMTCGFLFMLQRATTATTRATRPSSRASSASAARSSTRSSGPRTSTTRASGSS